MIKSASIISRDHNSILLDVDGSECAGCSGCASKTRKLIRVESDQLSARGEAVEISLGLSQFCFLLVSSLFLPLLGFVGGAVGAELANLSEVRGVGFSLLGLILGVLICRRLPYRQISIKEVM